MSTTTGTAGSEEGSPYSPLVEREAISGEEVQEEDEDEVNSDDDERARSNTKDTMDTDGSSVGSGGAFATNVDPASYVDLTGDVFCRVVMTYHASVATLPSLAGDVDTRPSKPIRRPVVYLATILCSLGAHQMQPSMDVWTKVLGSLPPSSACLFRKNGRRWTALHPDSRLGAIMRTKTRNPMAAQTLVRNCIVLPSSTSPLPPLERALLSNGVALLWSTSREDHPPKEQVSFGVQDSLVRTPQTPTKIYGMGLQSEVSPRLESSALAMLISTSSSPKEPLLRESS